MFFCPCQKKEGLSLSCVICTFLVSALGISSVRALMATRPVMLLSCSWTVQFSLCAVSVTFVRLGEKQSHRRGHTCTATHSLLLKSVPCFALDTQSTHS